MTVVAMASAAVAGIVVMPRAVMRIPCVTITLIVSLVVVIVLPVVVGRSDCNSLVRVYD